MSAPEPPRPSTPPVPPTEVLGTPTSTKLPWWQRRWGAITIGIVGAGIGGAAGGSTKTVTETQQASVQTVTNTVTTVHPRVVVHTHTVTVTAESHTTPPATPASSAGGEGQSYSGNGGKSLGTIAVENESTLEWTNDGSVFQIYTSEGVPVNSQAHSGTTVLEAGTYKSFQVNAVGNWTIKIVPKPGSTARLSDGGWLMSLAWFSVFCWCWSA